MLHRVTYPLGGILFVASVAWGDDIPPPRLIPVAALVAQLGSDSFAEREAAAKRLAGLDIVPHELSKALESDDPEVRKRASSVVTAIQNRRVEKVVGPGLAFARRGDVSLFVAATANWTLPPGDPRVWQVPFKLATDITNARPASGRTPSGQPPWRDLAYMKQMMPEVVLTAGRYKPEPKVFAKKMTMNYPQVVIANEYETPGRVLNSVLVARQKASIPDVVRGSGLFCNSSLERMTSVAFSLVVCDGDVQAEIVFDSLIIARGDIRVTGGLDSSILVAGGKVTCADPGAADPRNRNTLLSQQSNPLGFVKFFELSRVGLEVTDADKMVRIKRVADGKTFAAAGAKVGDVVEGVNGAKPESAESLRRFLRDALAVGDTTVTVRRGDAVHSLRVTLLE